VLRNLLQSSVTGPVVCIDRLKPEAHDLGFEAVCVAKTALGFDEQGGGIDNGYLQSLPGRSHGCGWRCTGW
jgi:hypothetical protein